MKQIQTFRKERMRERYNSQRESESGNERERVKIIARRRYERQSEIEKERDE